MATPINSHEQTLSKENSKAKVSSASHSTTAVTVIQVPEYFYAVDINYLSHMIADMLGRLISHNDLIPLTPSNLTRFHSRIPPTISLSDYLRRIIKFTSVEKSCLLIILIYIDRVCERHPQFTISSLTVHRFLITAVTLSSKALSDSYCTNSHYARIGGISTQELNALELEFLTLIDWRLASTGVILQQYYANLVEQHPCYQRMILLDSSPLLPPSEAQAPAQAGAAAQAAAGAAAAGGATSATITGVEGIQSNSNRIKNRKRRRRSSVKSAFSGLSEGSEDVLYGSDRDIDDDDIDDDIDEDDEEEKEIQRIWAHFDQLSGAEWIPYIA